MTSDYIVLTKRNYPRSSDLNIHLYDHITCRPAVLHAARHAVKVARRSITFIKNTKTVSVL